MSVLHNSEIVNAPKVQLNQGLLRHLPNVICQSRDYTTAFPRKQEKHIPVFAEITNPSIAKVNATPQVKSIAFSLSRGSVAFSQAREKFYPVNFSCSPRGTDVAFTLA